MEASKAKKCCLLMQNKSTHQRSRHYYHYYYYYCYYSYYHHYHYNKLSLLLSLSLLLLLFDFDSRVRKQEDLISSHTITKTDYNRVHTTEQPAIKSYISMPASARATEAQVMDAARARMNKENN